MSVSPWYIENLCNVLDDLSANVEDQENSFNICFNIRSILLNSDFETVCPPPLGVKACKLCFNNDLTFLSSSNGRKRNTKETVF